MRRIWKRHSMGGADEKKKSKSIFSGINGLFATHPPIEKRIEILEQF